MHWADILLLKKMTANLEFSDNINLLKEKLEIITFLEFKLFKLSMLLSYDPKENLAELGRESKQVARQAFDFQASTEMQKCLAMLKTEDKHTEAIIILREQILNLKKSQINHCREEKFYIPQNEIEKLENDYKIFESTNENIWISSLFSNMATVVWDQLVQKPIDDEELKVALCSFEIHFNKIYNLHDNINQLSLNFNRMQGNSKAYNHFISEIASMNELQVSFLNSFSLRSSLRTIRRLTNGKCTQAIDIYMVMEANSIKKRLDLLRKELSELACLTDMVVNKETLMYFYNQDIVQTESFITQYESMLSNIDYLKTERNRLNEEIFNAVNTLSEEEVEMLDKIAYDKKIHQDKCPVCLDERRGGGEKIVSLKCSVFHNLCINCAIKAFKLDSRCPLCRAYV